MRKLVNLKGQKFGRLLVVEIAGENNTGGAKWLCKCDCGNETIVKGSHLTNGNTKSCGCLRKEKTASDKTKHGHRYTKLYDVYYAMRRRCTNEKDKYYADYGGRGITVCDEWLNGFQAFYDWAVANGYQEGLSLDRANNDKGYSPDNCRWTTQKVQNNNTRAVIRIEINGEVKTAVEWSKISGVPYRTIIHRWHRGITGENLLKRG